MVSPEYHASLRLYADTLAWQIMRFRGSREIWACHWSVTEIKPFHLTKSFDPYQLRPCWIGVTGCDHFVKHSWSVFTEERFMNLSVVFAEPLPWDSHSLRLPVTSVSACRNQWRICNLYQLECRIVEPEESENIDSLQIMFLLKSVPTSCNPHSWIDFLLECHQRDCEMWIAVERRGTTA